MALKIGTHLPDLGGVTEWLNGQVSREDLLGSPCLVHFFAVSCHTCSEQMPRLRAWHDEGTARGLKMVAIHMPRSEADTEVDRVRDAVAEYGLAHPVGVDNLHAVTDRFVNEFVPAFYLFDHEGHLRLYAAGENAPKLLAPALERAVSRAEEARGSAEAQGFDPRAE